MGWKHLLNIGTTLLSLGGIGVMLNYCIPPVFAQDLNAQLKQAVCQQDWGGAIAIIDRFLESNPRDANRLMAYRNRLQQLWNNEVRLSDWPADCNVESDPSPSPPDLSQTRGQPLDPQRGAVAALDHLKTCTPFTSVPINVVVLDVIIEIKGKEGNLCLVDYRLVEGTTYMTCQYRPETITLITHEEEYEEARKIDRGEAIDIQTDFSDPRERAQSEAITQDCENSFGGS